MSTTLLGRTGWKGSMDKEGHRTFTIRHKVEAAKADGPRTIMDTAGLPAIGSVWSFGNDSDANAYCSPKTEISSLKGGSKDDPTQLWEVVQQFVTDPRLRCETLEWLSPFAEPPKLSGGFSRRTREAAFDRFGVPILSSSKEMLRGAQVEIDDAKPNVRIQMNIATNPVTAYAAFINTVNDATLWGMAKRSVKLADVSWARTYVDICTPVYSVTYSFDLDYLTFDRYLTDEGTKFLAPGGDQMNPEDYQSSKTLDGEPTRVLLDGSGGLLTDLTTPITFKVEFYGESNFLLLGIPASL